MREQKQIIAQQGSELSMEALSEMDVLQRAITEALRLFPPLIMLLRQCKRSFAVSTSQGQHYVIPKVSAPAHEGLHLPLEPCQLTHYAIFRQDRQCTQDMSAAIVPYNAPNKSGGNHHACGTKWITCGCMQCRLVALCICIADEAAKLEQELIVQGHVVATSPAYQHRLPSLFERPDDFEPDRFASPRQEDKAMPFSFIGFGGGRHGCMGSNFAFLQVSSHRTGVSLQGYGHGI